MLKKNIFYSVILAITTLFFTVDCQTIQAQSVHTVKTYYDVFNVHIKGVEQITDDFKLHGIQKYYYEDGAIQSIYNYKFNLKDGLQRTFFYNGQPQTIFSYKEDKLEGEQKEYKYLDSKYYLSQEALYANGVLIHQSEYFPNGKKQGLYQRNGVNTTLDENGIKIEEHTNVDGLMEGETKAWRNGKIAIIGHYLNDKEEGLWQYFDQTGEQIGYEGYKEGKDTGEARIYLDEHFIQVQNKTDARYLRAIDYRTHAPGWETVHHARDFNYSGEKYWGGYLMDNSTGSLLLNRKFLMVSHSQTLYKNGNVQVEGDYMVIANTEEPLKEKEWKYYTESGELDHIEHYIKGQLLSTISKEDANIITSHIGLANKYFESKAYDKALTEYQQVLKIDPSNQQASKGIQQSKGLNDSLNELYSKNISSVNQEIGEVDGLYLMRDEVSSTLLGHDVKTQKKKSLYDAYLNLKGNLINRIENEESLSERMVICNEVIALCEKMKQWANSDTKELEKSLKNINDIQVIEEKMGLK